MPDHPPPLEPAEGDHLSSSSYRRDFRIRSEETDGRDSWKFERMQHFEERDHPSREAFRRGDWEQSLRLMEERSPASCGRRTLCGRGSTGRASPNSWKGSPTSVPPN